MCHIVGFVLNTRANLNMAKMSLISEKVNKTLLVIEYLVLFTIITVNVNIRDGSIISILSIISVSNSYRIGVFNIGFSVICSIVLCTNDGRTSLPSGGLLLYDRIRYPGNGIVA